MKKDELINYVSDPSNRASLRGNDLGLDEGQTVKFNCKFASDDPDFIPVKIVTGEGEGDFFTIVNVAMKCTAADGSTQLQDVQANLDMSSIANTNLDGVYGVEFIGKMNKKGDSVYAKSNFRLDPHHASAEPKPKARRKAAKN